MTADKPSRLVPKLRFPEFRDAGDWTTKKLETQGSFLSSLTGKTAKDFDTGDAAFIPYMNVFSNTFTNPADIRSVHVASGETQNAVAKGDVFFTVSSETPEDAGMSSVLLEEIENCYLNSFCALFRFDEGKSPNPVFLGYLLRSPPAREHLSRGAQGATRYNIARTTFRNLPIPLPSPSEQQKIADCLGSLGDLIAAEDRKLEALRQHKQGLMQQLFPLPGETLPRLRFPEFYNTGEWETKQLEELVLIQSGSTPSKANPAFWDGSVPWVSAKDMKRLYLEDTEDHISMAAVEDGARIVPAGTLLMLTRGMTLRKDVPICVLRRKMSFNQDVKALRPKARVNGVFVAFVLLRNKHRLLNMVDVAGHGTGKLNTDELEAFELTLPQPAEQQRIAKCLSSLDDMLAAQSGKVDGLKTHKQALLQQLFPSLEGNG